ncbi:hypothetical protein E2C01_005865 [Portunus trituberculatus]|uniref:Uncharacterized protein n=1 Tax=Portunus trituberculatus TaxID=210409 RepID=A0A5B7CWL0_PORTR|nr:hypothetical protein [Portunus trituberculatus]
MDSSDEQTSRLNQFNQGQSTRFAESTRFAHHYISHNTPGYHIEHNRYPGHPHSHTRPLSSASSPPIIAPLLLNPAPSLPTTILLLARSHTVPPCLASLPGVDTEMILQTHFFEFCMCFKVLSKFWAYEEVEEKDVEGRDGVCE